MFGVARRYEDSDTKSRLIDGLNSSGIVRRQVGIHPVLSEIADHQVRLDSALNLGHTGWSKRRRRRESIPEPSPRPELHNRLWLKVERLATVCVIAHVWTITRLPPSRAAPSGARPARRTCRKPLHGDESTEPICLDASSPAVSPAGCTASDRRVCRDMPQDSWLEARREHPRHSSRPSAWMRDASQIRSRRGHPNASTGGHTRSWNRRPHSSQRRAEPSPSRHADHRQEIQSSQALAGHREPQ